MRLAPFVLLALTASARADDSAARAAKLFEEGRTLAKAGKLAEACDKFDQSFTLDAATGTEVNLADCLEKTGKLRRAWQLFDAAATDSLRANNTTRAKFARDRADALDKKLATIVLHVEKVPGLVIKIGDHGVTVDTEVTDRIEPGDIVILATAPQHIDGKWTIKAPAGERTDVAVALAPQTHIDTPSPPPTTTSIPSPAPPPPQAITTSHESRRDPGRVRLAWVLGATSGATALAGVGIAVYAKHSYDDAVAKNDIATANHEVHVSDVGTAFGAVSIACGAAAAIIYFTAPRENIVVTPTTNGVAVAGRF